MITYIATNTKTGKFYIGSTNCFESRKKQHLKSKRNYPFQNALRKDPDAFLWEYWVDDSTEPILEQALLDMFFGTQQCYNLSSNAIAFGLEFNPKTGKDNPLYGKPGHNRSKKWWVNGNGEETMNFLCPGEDWVAGRSKSHARKTSETLKGRHKGEKHPLSKLRDVERDDIKSRVKLGFGGNVLQLAKEFGVSGRQIRNIANKHN